MINGMQTDLLPADTPAAIEHAIRQASQLLEQGSLVAFPTDTVYGLAAAAGNSAAIEKLFLVKGRESNKAIAVLIGDFNALEQVASTINRVAWRLAERFWPGSLTLVVPRHASLPGILSPQPTIGVRMPDHPLALSLLKRTGPLAVTSANRSGQADAITAQQVLAQLGGQIPVIIDGGQTPGGKPSTVVDCTLPEPAILRQGPVSFQELQDALAGLSLG